MTSAHSAEASALPTNRRSVLGGAALASIIAASAAAPALAAGAEHPDPRIFELLRLYADSRKTLSKLDDVAEAAYENYVGPPHPEELFYREADYDLRVSIDSSKRAQCRYGESGEWRDFYEDEKALTLWAQKYWVEGDSYLNEHFGDDARARVREIKAAYVRWQSAIEEARHAAGVVGPDEDAMRAVEEAESILWRLATTPARTLDGIGAKAQAWACKHGHPTELLEQQIADLMLKPQPSWQETTPAMQLSVLADAQRLRDAAAATTGASDV